MNNQRIHDQIIERAMLRRKPDGYCESHHIKPRSMGGNDRAENLVWLSAREHYLVHWLLHRIHKSKATAFAWYRMTHSRKCVGRYVSHTFAYARGAHAQAMSELFSGRPVSEGLRLKFSAAKSGRTYAQMGRGSSPLLGRPLTEAHKAAVSMAGKGRRHSDATKAKLSVAKQGSCNPQFGKEISNDTRQKIAASLRKACHVRKGAVLIDIEGDIRTAAEWARNPICVVGESCITSRIRSGWSGIDAVLVPQLPRRGQSEEELIELKATYRRKLKELRAGEPVPGEAA